MITRFRRLYIVQVGRRYVSALTSSGWGRTRERAAHWTRRRSAQQITRQVRGRVVRVH